MATARTAEEQPVERLPAKLKAALGGAVRNRTTAEQSALWSGAAEAPSRTVPPQNGVGPLAVLLSLLQRELGGIPANCASCSQSDSVDLYSSSPQIEAQTADCHLPGSRGPTALDYGIARACHSNGQNSARRPKSRRLTVITAIPARPALVAIRASLVRRARPICS